MSFQTNRTLNDVHSQLNETVVSSVTRPETLEELLECVRAAARQGRGLSVAGGCHAMGGQQFRTDAPHIDMTALSRVLETDAVKGLLRMEAGAQWPAIIKASHRMPGPAEGLSWGIRQKQTGVDDVTLGGSVSANGHGRGLALEPIGGDIECLEVVTADGELKQCSRTENSELFSLVIGGFGLFGIIYSATLRLAPRRLVERVVDIIDLDDAVNAVFRRAEEGCLYGDFQFVIDPMDAGFLRRGVFACYKPVPGEASGPDGSPDLAPGAWLELIRLAHEDKREAFRQYALHYLNTNGNRYWSDTMQLSTYIPGYAEYVEANKRRDGGSRVKETLVIGEHYIRPCDLLEFMKRAREILKTMGTEVIYGTIRAIREDTVSHLPWAKRDSACVIFNLRTPHTEEGKLRTAETFRLLIDATLDLDGTFFLTYHRHATALQVERAYPRFNEWLALKLRHDPGHVFTSDWYEHYRQAFSEA